MLNRIFRLNPEHVKDYVSLLVTYNRGFTGKYVYGIYGKAYDITVSADAPFPLEKWLKKGNIGILSTK